MSPPPATAGMRRLRLSRRDLLAGGAALVGAVSALRYGAAPGERQAARMSQQIATLDLTGATTNQSGTVSWAQANIHSSQQQWVKGMRPYLELVNLSACTLAISLPRGGDNMPLPAGAWHVFPLSVEEFSYSYMVLNAQQNATANKVYGWYYAAFEEPPKTGQVVNQSQATAAAALASGGILNAFPGNGGVNATLGPSNTAASFNFASITVSFNSATGFAGVGRSIQIALVQVAGPTFWLCNVQESLIPSHFPLNVSIPNSTPGTTTVQVQAVPLSLGAAVPAAKFSLDMQLFYIASIS